ncbi:hypothetical protein [Actinomadura litoris]|uniref:hypothetical protein n=1 Tax=Actinomadura litoris TaxID=2678616 RepID=UPI001FA7EBD9|nr:hypothetical protein [Actinomadura litoris]
MLGVQLAALVGTPAGVDEALGLADGLDDALVHGLGRLGEQRAAALAALAGALEGSPLGRPVSEATGKLAAGSVADEQIAALAGARAAVFGAVHDALLARLDAALGRERAAWEEPAGPGGDDVPANLLSGCRSWLNELAIAGWRGVDHDLVSASDQTLEAALAEPRLRRLGVLLDGLAAELRASCPVATMDRLPVRRWADLWARGVLLAQPGLPGGGSPETVSGRLLPLGVDVHEHGTAVQIEVHGVLESSGGTRLVRTGVAAPKVDTIVGPAVWRLLGGHPVLMAALAERRSVTVHDLPLSAGHLRWDDAKAALAEAADPFATARLMLAGSVAPAVPPLERHPVRISEPVLVEGHTVNGTTWSLDGHEIEVDVERLPSCGPLTPALVAASTSCIGLLRWDGGRWRLQPLAVQATVKKKPVEAHTGDWALGPTDPKVVKAVAKSGDVVTVLRERAGRLLRK